MDVNIKAVNIFDFWQHYFKRESLIPSQYSFSSRAFYMKSYLPTDFFPLICIQCLYVSIEFLLWPLKITRHGSWLRKKHNIYFQIQHSISLPPLENNKVNWVTQPMPSCDTFASVLNIIQNLSNFFVPFLNTAGLLWIRIKNTSSLGPVAASKLQPLSSRNNTELTLWESVARPRK